MSEVLYDSSAFSITTAAPVVGGSMSYITSMSAYQVKAMSGAATPTNGFSTVRSVTPAAWLAGGTANDNIFIPWSGGAKSVTGTKLWVHGGGHGSANDSVNNGMYAFDFNGTTAPTGWTLPKISASPNNDLHGGYANSDGLPSSRHTYDGVFDLNGVIYRAGGSGWVGPTLDDLWKYTVATNTWQQLHNLPWQIRPFLTGNASAGTAGKLLALEREAQFDGYAFYNIATDTWGTAKHAGGQWPDQGTLAFKPLTATTSLGFVSGSGFGPASLAIDWTAETVVPTLRSLGAPVSTDGSSCFYDPVLDRFWAWGGGAGAISSIAEINPTTWAVTLHALSATIPAAEATTIGTMGRFVFLAAQRAIGVVLSRTDVPYVIKLP